MSLPGREGPLTVEFIVDTGLDGDLALPASLIARLEATVSDSQQVRLADGSQQERPLYEIILLENHPLIGVGLLEGNLLQAEMQDGGQVSLEPL